MFRGYGFTAICPIQTEARLWSPLQTEGKPLFLLITSVPALRQQETISHGHLSPLHFYGRVEKRPQTIRAKGQADPAPPGPANKR